MKPNLSLNPILVRELRIRMRGARPYLILSIFLLGMASAAAVIYLLAIKRAPGAGPPLSAQIGQILFAGLALVETGLIIFVAPAITSGAISGEHERLTYDMLMTTPLRPTQLLSGKLMATLCYLLLLIFASLPLFSLIILFGGVTPLDALWALLLLLSTTVTLGSLGMLCSTIERHTIRATMLSYVLTLFLLVGSFLGHRLWLNAAEQPEAARRSGMLLLALNPFSAMASITTSNTIPQPSFNGSQPYVLPGLPDSFRLLTFFSDDVILVGEQGPIVVPIYRTTLLLYSLISLLALWLSSHTVRHRQRWRLGWPDLAFALLLLTGGTLLFSFS